MLVYFTLDGVEIDALEFPFEVVKVFEVEVESWVLSGTV